MSFIDLDSLRVNHLSLHSPYGYTPSKAPGLAYLIVFAILTLIHVGLGIRYRYWIAFVTLIPGGLLEIIGWGGRLWSAESVLKVPPFLMQICCLILGPAFFSAWCYTLLGYCITRLGSSYSLLKPKWYLIVFISADIVSLVLQAIGGGRAAIAAQNGTPTRGATKVMLSGILFQLGTMTIFSVLAIDFILRVIARRPYKRLTHRDATPQGSTETKFEHNTNRNPNVDPENTTNDSDPDHLNPDPEHHHPTTPSLRKAELLLTSVAFAAIMIYVRGVYRSIELAQGWSGYLITREVYFVWLDGFPMVLCLAGFAVGHPGWLLPRRQGWWRA